MTTGIDTAEVLKRLDKLNSNVEVIQSDIQDIKLSQARTEERFNSVDQRFNSVDQRFDSLEKSVNKRFDSLEQRTIGQENRFWGLVALLTTSLLGVIAKVAFFPVGRL